MRSVWSWQCTPFTSTTPSWLTSPQMALNMRALAGTVRADDRDQLAAADRERHVVQRVAVAVAHAEVARPRRTGTRGRGARSCAPQSGAERVRGSGRISERSRRRRRSCSLRRRLHGVERRRRRPDLLAPRWRPGPPAGSARRRWWSRRAPGRTRPTASSVFADGSSVGETPAIDTCVEAVRGGEVPEGTVAGDERRVGRTLPGRRGSPGPVDRRRHSRRTLAPTAPSAAVVSPVATRASTTPPAIAHHVRRVEPDVRVLVAVQRLAAGRALGAGQRAGHGQQREPFEQVDLLHPTGATPIAFSTFGWKPWPR